MAKRISIVPGPLLLTIREDWRRKFAEASAEILIEEGRYSEVMLMIIGLKKEDLLAGKPGQPNEGDHVEERIAKEVI
jgi:hypothetical protein